VFGLGVGPTRVELRWKDRALSFAWMDQPLPEFRPPVVSVDAITRAVGVDQATVASTGLPVEEVSCGVPYLCLPLATRAAVDAANPDMPALRRLASAFAVGHVGVYLFTLEPTGPGVTAYTRMFVAGVGIPEDPATGSACGPLGSYLVRHGLVQGDAATKMISWQGVAMGRPSCIHIAITAGADRNITRVQVGGQAVLVAEGTLDSGDRV
jgi:trans-2,3-dihydro-3-hydroxyanthranilate isomerase